RPSNSGGFSTPNSVGTLVEIIDFDRLDDGCLGITVAGRRRFRVLASRQADNGLWWGRIECLPDSRDADCPAEFDLLKDVTAALLEQAGAPWSGRHTDYDSAAWLSARLT